MTKVEANLVLLECKPIIAQVIATKGLYQLSKRDWESLQKLKQACDEGILDDASILQAADMSNYELSLLLGTISLYERRGGLTPNK